MIILQLNPALLQMTPFAENWIHPIGFIVTRSLCTADVKKPVKIWYCRTTGTNCTKTIVSSVMALCQCIQTIVSCVKAAYLGTMSIKSCLKAAYLCTKSIVGCVKAAYHLCTKTIVSCVKAAYLCTKKMVKSVVVMLIDCILFYVSLANIFLCI